MPVRGYPRRRMAALEAIRRGVCEMASVVEATPGKVAVEFTLERNERAWPWTIEAMMSDIGPRESEEPVLFAAARDYLLQVYEQRVRDEVAAPPLWDFDCMYRAFVAGYRAALRDNVG